MGDSFAVDMKAAEIPDDPSIDSVPVGAVFSSKYNSFAKHRVLTILTPLLKKAVHFYMQFLRLVAVYSASIVVPGLYAVLG